ncbi:MAG: sigma-70 family RNA polymerase sigma factor [Candidatus Korobacteraceae bacterium]|jgi:RNA polymerase sigma-70 factor (ECF subfamily)
MDFEALAGEHKDAVYRQLIRACGNREDAEDVLVEALLKAYRNLGRLRDSAAFRAWLAQIGRRVCWQLKQREALLPIMQLSAMEASGIQLQSDQDAPDLLAARQEMKQLLRQAIESLPEAERTVYQLRDLEEASGEQVAARLGLSLAAMKSRLHRARASVRHYLDAALTPGPDAATQRRE